MSMPANAVFGALGGREQTLMSVTSTDLGLTAVGWVRSRTGPGFETYLESDATVWVVVPEN